MFLRWVGILVALQGLDTISTLHILQTTTGHHEGNPLAAAALSYGVWSFIALKTLGTLLILLLARALYNNREPPWSGPHLSVWMLRATSLAMALIVLSNFTLT